MTLSKPIRLADGRVYRDSRAKSLELREPLERSVARCLSEGTPVEAMGRRSFQLGWQPDCESPVPWLAFGSRSEYARGSRDPIFVHGFGRCRKCEACKKARSQMWQIRAMQEFSQWPVTLFGTITMSMEEHYRLDAMVIQGTRGKDGRYIRHPANPAAMSTDELFAARVGVFGDEAQKFLKRLRKGDKFHRPAIRYLLVAEAHDGPNTSQAMRGRPHMHIMLHEQEPGSLVLGNPRDCFIHGQSGEYILSSYKTSSGEYRKGVFVHDDSFLRTQWQLGYTKFQFAENARAAGYLCKYLNKASDARVRASLGYGVPPENNTFQCTPTSDDVGEKRAGPP